MTRSLVVPDSYVGPPGMGHGGYVAGLLLDQIDGAATQITLRRPTPVGVPLRIEVADGTARLVHDGGSEGPELIAEATATALDLDVPAPPALADARVAEAGSPSRWDERGVHPICLGCGLHRDDPDGLEVTVGPLEVDGTEQVAATWRPGPGRARPGTADQVDPLWVLAVLDCPGAMAWIARDTRVGLLGRITFQEHAPAVVGEDHIVTGWQIRQEGRKHDAGTALFRADGTLLAAAKAVWFSFE